VLVVELLKAAQEPVGLGIFDWGGTDPLLFFDLRTSIGIAVRSQQLIHRIRRQAQELSAANVELKRLRANEEHYIETVRNELALARRIQAGFLPQTLPEPAGWDLAVHFEPALEVAGDFYDLFTVPDGRLAVVVADVCGKGVGAALFMSLVRSVIRVLNSESPARDPAEVAAAINNYLYDNFFIDGMSYFVTLFYGLLDTSTGEIAYVNAGHPGPVVTSATGAQRVLQINGPAAGIVDSPRYVSSLERLGSGDLVLLYTDGVTEAYEGEEGVLGREALEQILQRHRGGAQAAIDAIRSRLQDLGEGGRLTDDVTMVALRRA
jgi:serine phosphatase RsbU (regulator of sigma subunit)